MNVLEYFETIVDSLQDYRWVIELANHCYPIAAMAKMHGSAHILNPRRKTKPIPVKRDSSDLPSSSLAEEYCGTTTTNAIETTEISTDDTLDMISTPWSSKTTTTTDSWTDVGSANYLTFVNKSDTFTSVSIQPKTSTTFGLPTPFTSNSRITVTLMSHYMSQSNQGSRVIPPLEKKSQTSHETSTWTMESYTSTGRFNKSTSESRCSRRLRVKYPWSPKTFSFTDLTDCYPDSTNTLSSQKVSRESFSATKEADKMMPMNYIAISLDENVLFDWILVKQRGLDGPKLLVPAKV